MRALAALLLVVILLAVPPATARAASGGAEDEHAKKGATEFIFKVINFALVVAVLIYFLRRPAQRFFAGQRAAIRGAIEEARQARQHSRERLGEVERRLARLEQEVEAMRTAAAASATAEKQRIHETAQREAERILSTTRVEIESATRAARLELRAYTARLAVNLAEQRIQQQLTPESHAALVQAFVSDVSGPSGASPRPDSVSAAGRNRRQ